MALKLKRLTPEDGQDVYAMLQSIPTTENGFQNSANGLTYEEYLQWLKRQDECSHGINLPEGWVPQTIYWLYDGDTPVGVCKLRHYLSDALRKNGGHIGYGIAPGYRGKGYGKEQLRLVLGEAKKLGIGEALITADNGNLASIHVALHNGGVIQKVTEDKHYIVVPV